MTKELLQTSWQLIETAPKDGEFFLAIEFGKLLPFVTAWDEDAGWFTFNCGYEALLKTDWKPTHWMPLPAVPKAAQGAIK